MITLNNLSDREMKIADLIWQQDTKDGLLELIEALDRDDKFRAAGIIKLIQWGGDDVNDLDLAKKVLSRF